MVSRIVIRQALIRLAEDGLVTIEHHRGAFVARPSLQEALEIYDTLTILEQGVASQLADRLSSAGWAELRQHIGRQRQAIESENHELADEIAQDFHSLLVRLSGNRVVQEFHAQLVRRTRLLRSLYRSQFDYCHLMDDHEDIVGLLESGRIDEAKELIDTHHRRVVRGYIMEGTIHPQMSLKEALEGHIERPRRSAGRGGQRSAERKSKPEPKHLN